MRRKNYCTSEDIVQMEGLSLDDRARRAIIGPKCYIEARTGTRLTDEDSVDNDANWDEES